MLSLWWCGSGQAAGQSW